MNLFKKIKDYYNKEDKQKEKRLRDNASDVVAYVRPNGIVVLWPSRIDPNYAMGIYGMVRVPHLDPPKKKLENV